jgi:hypothetical protein
VGAWGVANLVGTWVKLLDCMKASMRMQVTLLCRNHMWWHRLARLTLNGTDPIGDHLARPGAACIPGAWCSKQHLMRLDKIYWYNAECSGVNSSGFKPWD